MKLNNLTEIFDLKNLEYLVLDSKTSIADIYTEAQQNNLFVTIEVGIYGQYIVRMSDMRNATNSSLAEYAIKPFTNQDFETTQMNLPDIVNQSSLLSALYRQRRLVGVDLRIELCNHILKIYRKEDAVHMAAINRLSKGKSITVLCPDYSDVNRLRYAIRKKQHNEGITLKTTTQGNRIRITWPNDSTENINSKRTVFDNWIDQQPWDTWVVAHPDFVNDIAYCKHLASSHYSRSIKVKGYSFMRKSLCISKDRGEVVIRHMGMVIYKCGVKSVKEINKETVSVVLSNIGKTLEDLY